MMIFITVPNKLPVALAAIDPTRSPKLKNQVHLN
jgi:hypothetical protein